MSPRDRRVLRVGIATVAVLVLGLRIVPALIRAERILRESVGEQRVRVVRLRADLGAFPVLEDSAEVLSRAVVALAPRLVSGTSEAEAGVELALIARALFESAGARVLRATGIGDSVRAGLVERVAARIEAETDATGLANTLAGFVAQPTVLEVASLRVNALEPEAEGTGAERLRVEVIVRGWWLTRSDSSRAMLEGA